MTKKKASASSPKGGRPLSGLVTVACRVTPEALKELVRLANEKGITLGGYAGVLLHRALGLKGHRPRPANGKYVFKARPRNKRQLSLLKEG